MGLTPTQESQKVAFVGKHLTLFHEYTPSQPRTDLEMAALEGIDALLTGKMSVNALCSWIHGVLDQVRDTPDEYLPIVGVLQTILNYKKVHHYDLPEQLLYSDEEVIERVEDIWNWMALGMNATLAKVPKSGPLPLPERVPSLLEQDIRVKLGEYLASQMVLPELIGWLQNPLLLWDMLAQAGTDPVFYEWVMSLHRILTFYTESRDTREQEVYDLLSRLVQA